MVMAVILAGGSGNRMGGGSIPKQYRNVGDKMLLSYCLHTFQHCPGVDGIVVVAGEAWHERLQKEMKKEGITKFSGFAVPGRTRQHSVYNGLKVIKEREEKKKEAADGIVIIHDAARPCVSREIIKRCIEGAKKADGAMPVIPVKDTVYYSKDGGEIERLLNRDCLYAGQAPESFRLDRYWEIHQKMTDEELGQIRGSSEIAHRFGMKIQMVEGSEQNFKITTEEDMERFLQVMQKENS